MYSFKEVFLLDLCTLAYQLHSQTLVWPMDPYYEQLSGLGGLRDTFINAVRAQNLQPFTSAGGNWRAATTLDPINAQYDRVFPWRPSFTRALPGEWILYNTPPVITQQIQTVKAAVRDRGQPPAVAGQVANGAKPPSQAMWLPGQGGNAFVATNPSPAAGTPVSWLYCFEGSTGQLQETAQGAWSILGFVLAEFPAGVGQPYDVYVVFRGSRSGRVGLKRARGYLAGNGNADWVSDLGLPTVSPEPAITEYGCVSPGFGLAAKSALPTIMLCLDDIATAVSRATQTNTAPRTIYVTGHSLGGALAAHFTSAVTLGSSDYYGPWGTGRLMPSSLQGWPWRSVQLTTFSAPSVGDAKFQWAFDSRVPSTRIWLDGDPITQERINNPVGVPVRVPWTSENGQVKAKGVDLNSHEPRNLRRDLIKQWRRDYPAASMTDVPANTGDEDSLEPWKVFTSYWEMLALLKGSAGASLRPPGALAGFAQNFAQNFRGYEAQLSLIVAREESRSAAQALDAFQQGLPTAAQMQTMKDNLAYNLFDFICICYALCDASSTQSLAAYDPASNRILANEKLK